MISPISSASHSTLPESTPDILWASAEAQLDALSRRRISARELLEASVAQADRHAWIKAVCARDIGPALAEAQATDDRRARGEQLPALAGLPMTIKDSIDVEDMPAACGMKALLNRKVQDAEVVRRLRAAGAVIWGKTNTPVKAADWQTFNPLYGQTNNPWDASRTPGGSSGGSAAALAAGITALEIGADIGGSLRIPSSFCGVAALKPTYGLVPQEGIAPPHPGEMDLAVVGPMARSARDLRLLMSVIAPQPAVEPLSIGAVRVAVWLDAPGFDVDPEVRAVLLAYAKRLAESGAAVEEIASPVDPMEVLWAYTARLYAVMGKHFSGPERTLFGALRPAALLALKMGEGPRSWAQGIRGATDRAVSGEATKKLNAAMAEVFTRYDVVLCPVSPTAAFRHDHGPFLARRVPMSAGKPLAYLKMMDWPALATLCGLPAAAIPAGATPGGLPVGVQLIGAHGSDARTLAIAELFEQANGGFRKPPLRL